ncbi:integrase catalytic domain-containing protein [Nephila pilipes]|uniref:Integrase catalytic domain-containing protein n=1 Tax=Nephila pilipes TaxID=299642 RepID=A0A8X6PS91_NEPPI|nr:integrase catalytic domain-containing protein [Nephila pilipes]
MEVLIESLDRSFNCNFDQDIICNDVPSVSYEPWIEELQSMNIQMFDMENHSGPIDVLVGADVAGRLFTGIQFNDLITSLDNEAKILPLFKESPHNLAEGKFNLRGWKYTGDDDPEQVTSVLGLIWNRKEDEMKINLDWIETFKLEIESKRVILSVTHRVFNPNGFLCPVFLIPKLMLQKMWKDNIPWDKEVEDNL